MKNSVKKILLGVMIITSTLKSTAQIIATPPNPKQQKERLEMQKRVKEAAAKKAAADKVLNATLVKIDLYVAKEKVSNEKLFNNRTISIESKKNGDVLSGCILGGTEGAQPIFIGGQYNEKLYSFNQNAPKCSNYWLKVKTHKYQDFLESGCTIGIYLNDRIPKEGSRLKDYEYAADFKCVFYFSDGTKVELPMQALNLSNKGTWISKDQVMQIVKKFAPNVFPDPNNPLVLQTVK